MAATTQEVRIAGLEDVHAEELRGVKVGSVLVIRTYSIGSEGGAVGSRAEVDEEGDESEEEGSSDGGESSDDGDGDEESAPTDRATDGGSERNVGQGREGDQDEDDGESLDEGEISADGGGFDDEDEASSEDDFNNGDEDGDEGESQANSEIGTPRTLTYTNICVVLSAVTAEDDDTTIADLLVRRLSYQHPGTDANQQSFRLYGNTVRLHDATCNAVAGEAGDSVVAAVEACPEYEFVFTLNPTGDTLRRVLFGAHCPANCHQGWLASQNDLTALLSGPDLPSTNLQPYHPICPVCLGLDLLTEQVTLRTILSLQGHIDIGLVVEWLGRLNPRRRGLGYGFKQFDEREWGFAFEDMLDEGDSEDGSDGGIGGGFEQWDEAMDPNANPKTRPAREGTMEKLHRCTYGELGAKKRMEIVGEGEEAGASCAICRDGFATESDVVALTCGHVFDQECLASWIKQYDNCPECGARVSGMVEMGDAEVNEAGDEGGDQDGEEAATGAGAGVDERMVDDGL